MVSEMTNYVVGNVDMCYHFVSLLDDLSCFITFFLVYLYRLVSLTSRHNAFCSFGKDVGLKTTLYKFSETGALGHGLPLLN